MRRHARFPLENVVERSSDVDTNYKRSVRNQPSMYQSRGKQSRHGGNCANRIINTFRPLHYGCNERFLCTFARISRRCLRKLAIDRCTLARKFAFKVTINVRRDFSLPHARLNRDYRCTSFVFVIVKNHLYYFFYFILFLTQLS